MSLRELVEEALRRGEGEEIEFKLRLDKEAARALCGLANHRGGLLLIGVNDQGEPVGAPRDSLERLNSLLGSIYPRPRVRAEWTELKGAGLLAIWVEAGGRVYRLGDDVYIRVGSSTRKASPEEIASLYAERAELRFDEAVREDLGIGVLSRELLDRYIELAVKRGRVPQEAQTWGFEEALNALKAASGSSPTNAGLLMVSENPSKYIQGADIRVVVQDAGGRVIDDKWFSSPLWLLVNKVADHLREEVMALGWEVRGPEMERIELPEYPLEALREALVNAVTHRNYLTPGITLVKVTPEGISVENPGGFPPGVTPERPVSRPRNPILADLMYRIGLVEEMGTGIRRMREACNKAGIIFRIDEWTSWMTRVSFTKASNKLEAEIIRLLAQKGPLPTHQIAQTLKTSRPTILKALENLQKRGIITATGKTRDRKYQLTTKP